MLETGMKIAVNGEVKTVAKWQAEWSLMLSMVPHRLFILWEGGEKFERFLSDANGEFAELEAV